MKSLEEARARLSGLFNIAVTPFAPDGVLDKTALAANIERMMGLGYNGILIGGTYGEFATMSPSERAALFRYAMDVVGERVPVMLCSGGSDPREVADLTRLAGELGGIPMVTPPYVSEVTDEQIVAFFREIAPLSRTGLLIYNAPGVGVTLSPALLERLAELPQMVGVKQGDLTPTAIDDIANRLSGRLRLFCASDLAFLGPLMCGFDGVSSTNSGSLPELVLAIFAAVRDGDAGRAITLHRSWYDYRRLARRLGQPQTVKAAMRLRGWRGGAVRAPLRDLSEEQEKMLGKVMAALAATEVGWA